MKEIAILNPNESIKNKIFTIRNTQVMLDSDLAELYGVSTKVLNQAVNRNIERFPKNFRFQLTKVEYDDLNLHYTIIKEPQTVTSQERILRSQIVTLNEETLRFQNGTLNSNRGKHRKYLPYAFTEEGVAMLSGVLKSETAVNVSIQIINAFVAMHKFISKNLELFSRLDSIEQKHLEFKIKTNKNFEKVFAAIEDKTFQKKQGIFFEGQIFDAYKFVSDLVRSAKKSIVLIDNYIDDSVLTLFSKRDKSVQVVIYTNNFSKQLRLDLNKYNSQYKPIQIKEFKHSHDRFMIIDEKEVYHIGASLKDLGKKWFAFSRFDKSSFKLLEKLR